MNAASAALVDAGVSMAAVVGAAQCCVHKSGRMMVDPTTAEEAVRGAVLRAKPP